MRRQAVDGHERTMVDSALSALQGRSTRTPPGAAREQGLQPQARCAPAFHGRDAPTRYPPHCVHAHQPRLYGPACPRRSACGTRAASLYLAVMAAHTAMGATTRGVSSEGRVVRWTIHRRGATQTIRIRRASRRIRRQVISQGTHLRHQAFSQATHLRHQAIGLRRRPLDRGSRCIHPRQATGHRWGMARRSMLLRGHRPITWLSRG